MITFGPIPAIGDPRQLAKNTTGITRDGETIGAIYWIPEHHPNAWTLILRCTDCGNWPTEDAARAEALAREAHRDGYPNA
ncbi:hypothetical protein V8N76_004579 [Salmonella enterica]